jgi:hypothetical protein
MEAKQLTLVLTAVTATIWGVEALVSFKTATCPLLGLLPLKSWHTVSEGGWYLLLLPIAVYLCVPVLAWKNNSKKIAWCIPVAPLLGITSFIVQFAIGMTAFS